GGRKRGSSMSARCGTCEPEGVDSPNRGGAVPRVVRWRLRAVPLLCRAACVLAALSPLWQAAAQPEEEKPEPASHIIPAGQIDLARLVDLAAQELGLRVE